MKYSMEVEEEFKFNKDLTVSELSHLQKFLGEDIRDHSEWEKNKYSREFNYIDLRITEDFSGIEWDGSEKTYGLCDQINYIISQMIKIKPDFKLEGKFICRGEDFDDRYKIIIKDGIAQVLAIEVIGTNVTCPCCGKTFILEESK